MRAQGIVDLRYTEMVAFVVISPIDVETFATWAMTLIVKVMAVVRVTGEAVVIGGHEVQHGAGITEAGEIPTGVGVIILLRIRQSGGRDGRQSILG
jgi:hypothetical protein